MISIGPTFRHPSEDSNSEDVLVLTSMRPVDRHNDEAAHV